MFPAVQIGPLALQTSPLILLFSVMLALEVSQRAATRLGMDGDAVYNMGYLAAIAALLGARLGYVLEYWSVFSDNLAAIFALTGDGLSPLAGLGVGLIVGYAYAQRKGLDKQRLLDVFAPGLAVLAAGVALADLANGSSYGSLTSLPWAMSVWNEPRHPVQVYHLLATIAIVAIVLLASRPFDGAHFGLFVALYAASRLFLEAFHGDSATIARLRTVQVASLAVLLLALLTLRRWAVDGSVTKPVVTGLPNGTGMHTADAADRNG